MKLIHDKVTLRDFFLLRKKELESKGYYVNLWDITYRTGLEIYKVSRKISIKFFGKTISLKKKTLICESYRIKEEKDVVYRNLTVYDEKSFYKDLMFYFQEYEDKTGDEFEVHLPANDKGE